MLSAHSFRVSFSMSPPTMKLLEPRNQFAASRSLLRLQFQRSKEEPVANLQSTGSAGMCTGVWAWRTETVLARGVAAGRYGGRAWGVAWLRCRGKGDVLGFCPVLVF
ncbi:uncharacterized protein LOC108477178 [Gossypium arboreum]|uniref:uncharacterized protein LOC108477178 n=1 Tax=Gossypium arboreum TaxID=29729 RepID=UPI0008192EDF|nr:uncharacterized protein LOC108477178 [Gossypium arboreum]